MSQLKAMYSTLVEDGFPEKMTIILGDEKLVFEKRHWDIKGEKRGLRYGENPDQPAALYRLVEGEISCGGLKWRGPGNAMVSAITGQQMIQAGKHPGKTNLTDVDNGINILQYLTEKPACVILKHNNPCGAAWAARDEGGLETALERAYWSDRIAAFGGAVVINTAMSKQCASMIAGSYFEVVAAPSYEDGAAQILMGRKNLRILELPGLGRLDEMLASAWLDFKSLSDGGIIVQKSFQNRILQNSDFLAATARNSDGTEVSARCPSKAELDDLRFAWAVEAGVSSNSVIFAKDGATIAIGTGEQDRVGCVELAIHKAGTKYADTISFRELGLSLYELRAGAETAKDLEEKLADIEKRTKDDKAGLIGSRVVSDGFFPFRDGVDSVIAQGVTAIAQPGGAMRDAEAIMACNEAVPQVAMVFTAQRSFKH